MHTCLPDNIIYEVAPSRPKVLKDLEDEFAKLSENESNRRVISNITNLLKKFTGIRQLHFRLVQNVENMYSITIYNDNIRRDLVNTFKKQQNQTGRVTNVTVRREHATKYIQQFYLFYGTEVLRTCTPQENVAVVLHEIGHGFAHTTNLPNMMLAFNDKLRDLYSRVKNIMFTPVMLVLVFIIANLSRSLSFFEHAAEYNADDFVAKYGYGDELARVLTRYSHVIKKHDQSTWYQRLFDFVKKIFKPGMTHPIPERRICQLKKSLTNEYKQKYRPISRELDVIFSNIQC